MHSSGASPYGIVRRVVGDLVRTQHGFTHRPQTRYFLERACPSRRFVLQQMGDTGGEPNDLRMYLVVNASSLSLGLAVGPADRNRKKGKWRAN
jgi:hypothetical protein